LRPGQETNLPPPYLNLRYFGSKCIVLKKNIRHYCDFSAPPSDSVPGVLSHPHYAPGVTLRDKVRSCEIRRALNVEPLLLIERAQLKLVGPCIQNAQPNERLVRHVLLAKPTRKRPRCRPRYRWSNCISDLSWSRLDVEPAELSEIAIDREVFQVLLWMLPRNSPRKKSGHENE